MIINLRIIINLWLAPILINNFYKFTPYVEIGQIATAFYFSFYFIIVPVIGLIENTLMDLATDNN